MAKIDDRGERGIAVKTSIRDVSQFRRRLLAWFGRRKRDLPWRRTSDPYRVWISEIMLQQTRVAAVIPYYARFVRRFPTVRALAKAPLNEVLRLWAGLGYYSRARNLHRAAKEIVARHGGRFPCELDAALALPGIGRYSAAAVLSIAYGTPLAVLDGNVARVLARLGAIRGDLRAPGRWAKLQQTAQELLATRSPGDWNQTVMELGATVCTPRAPKCGECPLARWCKAFREGIAEEIPAARKKRAPVKVQLAAAVLLDPRGRTLLVRYPNGHTGEEDALFSRMWQFPALKVTAHAARKLREHLAAQFGIRADGAEALPRAGHSVTFREVTLLPSLLRVDSLPRVPATGRANRIEFRTPRLSEISALPISNATRKIAESARQFIRTL
jgi:A/G-specific adenine glycosylase